jgi:hypothetical protein
LISALPSPTVYYVASPEACAAILWKSRDAINTVRVVGVGMGVGEGVGTNLHLSRCVLCGGVSSRGRAWVVVAVHRAWIKRVGWRGF